MYSVLELQALLPQEEPIEPRSAFSMVSAAGCVWTTVLPFSTLSVAVC